jgi:hypothetical protein
MQVSDFVTRFIEKQIWACQNKVPKKINFESGREKVAECKVPKKINSESGREKVAE